MQKLTSEHIGFTGTRRGLTLPQRDTLINSLDGLLSGVANPQRPNITHANHGDCIGADAQFHQIVRRYAHIHIWIHPPVYTEHAAWCEGDKRLPPKTYFARNRDIVNGCGLLFACPAEMTEQLHYVPRGGTWYTIRYALKTGIRCVIIYPDGSIEGSGNTNA